MGKNLCKVENKWNYMTQEDKKLLFKDLCARLPYGLKYNYGGYDGCDYTMNRVDCNAVDCSFPIEDVKPYLFPLSSITKEQLFEVQDILGKNEIEIEDGFLHIIDSDRKTITYLEILALLEWFYKNHFDINNLIAMGLAINATGLNVY